MALHPLYEQDAPPKTREYYNSVKEALGLPYLPLFFAYLGRFPAYLEYIHTQMISNLASNDFKLLINNTGRDVESLIRHELTHSQRTDDWLDKYATHPEYGAMREKLDEIFEVNTKMAFIFIGLREAVKGWAVAAHKLPEYGETMDRQVHQGIHPDEFIYSEMRPAPTPSGYNMQSPEHKMQNYTMVVKTSGTAQPDMLQLYFTLCRQDYEHLLKTEQFWILRVGIEKILLSSITLMPHLIFSPVNVVMDLCAQYQDFPDLLHLLGEHFPTYATQRMIFSGYMKR